MDKAAQLPCPRIAALSPARPPDTICLGCASQSSPDLSDVQKNNADNITAVCVISLIYTQIIFERYLQSVRERKFLLRYSLQAYPLLLLCPVQSHRPLQYQPEH